MAKVVLENVSKIFGSDIKAVDNVNLEIKDREFLVLVGPSGCGKSTTLRMVAGLETITTGKIYISDLCVNDIHPKDRDIAMVFQSYALYPHMNVFDNMAFGLKLRNYPKEEINRRVQDAAEILGIKQLLERKPRQLSGGQRQRVAVGRAIVRKPKVFLFDEPLSNLDAKMRVQMRTEISKLHNRLKVTMIYVTHDQVEAMTMGDRIVVLKGGIIQQVADPMTLYEKPKNMFVAGFIGSPPINFINGMISKIEDDIFFNEKTFKVKVPDEMVEKLKPYVNKEVTMGVRPENIYDKLFAPGASSTSTITATVEVIEPMGSGIYLYLTAGEHNLVASVSAQERVNVNEEIEIVIDMTRSHFFDKETELTIV
ncbi:MAG: sn-glycerol-3-phosphate ABC transporter ATP-binding protein UgpC [Candidatus Aureabacteria bacterium]|nr:sn-glycerol-3-phosphate ABC transporter ATP-binding protein UgpC [Candidatus Auribacterota bacterium]